MNSTYMSPMASELQTIIDNSDTHTCIVYLTKTSNTSDPNLYIQINIKYPSWIEENAKDLINKLLNKDPEKRIGSGKEGAENIKKHPFFSDIDWNKPQ